MRAEVKKFPTTVHPMPDFHTVCQVDEVPEGEARMFVVHDTPVGIFHVDGEFFALHNECPHAGASLAHGTIDDGVVTCRIHYWRFRIRDGTYLDETCPRRNARSILVRVVDQQVEVEI